MLIKSESPYYTSRFRPENENGSSIISEGNGSFIGGNEKCRRLFVENDAIALCNPTIKECRGICQLIGMEDKNVKPAIGKTEFFGTERIWSALAALSFIALLLLSVAPVGAADESTAFGALIGRADAGKSQSGPGLIGHTIELDYNVGNVAGTASAVIGPGNEFEIESFPGGFVLSINFTESGFVLGGSYGTTLGPGFPTVSDDFLNFTFPDASPVGDVTHTGGGSANAYGQLDHTVNTISFTQTETTQSWNPSSPKEYSIAEQAGLLGHTVDLDYNVGNVAGTASAVIGPGNEFEIESSPGGFVLSIDFTESDFALGGSYGTTLGPGFPTVSDDFLNFTFPDASPVGDVTHTGGGSANAYAQLDHTVNTISLTQTETTQSWNPSSPKEYSIAEQVGLLGHTVDLDYNVGNVAGTASAVIGPGNEFEIESFPGGFVLSIDFTESGFVLGGSYGTTLGPGFPTVSDDFLNFTFPDASPVGDVTHTGGGSANAYGQLDHTVNTISLTQTETTQSWNPSSPKEYSIAEQVGLLGHTVDLDYNVGNVAGTASAVIGPGNEFDIA